MLNEQARQPSRRGIKEEVNLSFGSSEVLKKRRKEERKKGRKKEGKEERKKEERRGGLHARPQGSADFICISSDLAICHLTVVCFFVGGSKAIPMEIPLYLL